MKNNFLILSTKQTDIDAFVKYWKRFYDYRNEADYQSFINKKAYNSSDIAKMFKWKNNITLSKKKNVTVSFVTKHLSIVNSFKKSFDMDLFSKTFKKIGAIWKIFLLHAIKPSEFPIYDQHVHRAFRFIRDERIEEIPSSNNLKFQIYKEDYLPFFKDVMSKSTCDSKEIDEAFWCFGKMIKKHPGLVMICYDMQWAELKNLYITNHLSKKLKAPCIRLTALKSIEENLSKYYPELKRNPKKIKEIKKNDLKAKLIRHKQNGKLNGAEQSVINDFYKILEIKYP